jgi:hypothetical protein
VGFLDHLHICLANLLFYRFLSMETIYPCEGHTVTTEMVSVLVLIEKC